MKISKDRPIKKNGAGRVIYFDLFMIAEFSLLHLEDRAEMINEANKFEVKTTAPFKKAGKERRAYNERPTLGERTKNQNS